MSVTYGKLAARLATVLDNDTTRGSLPRLNSDQITILLKLSADIIIEALSEGEDVELEGFGRFYPNIKPPKTVRSGITQQSYNVGHRVIVKFNPFSKMSNKVDMLLKRVNLAPKEAKNDSARK